MASVNLSLAVVVALFSGFVILGAVVGDDGEEDECGYLCQTYLTCNNYPGYEFPGCTCLCGPEDGHGCVIHEGDGSGAEDCNH